MDPRYKSPTPEQSIGPIQDRSWRRRLAEALIGNSESYGRQQFVEGMLGSDGLGEAGVGLADFAPGGQILAAQEALQAGDPQSAALAIVPSAPAAGKAAKGTAKKLAKELIGVDTPAPYPHLAERYPDVPEPVLAQDKKSGKEYLAKGESPEVKQFMKDRLAIQKQMDEQGYDPYFPPQERFDADPSRYPRETETLTNNVPARPETQAKYSHLMQPETLARLDEAMQRGMQIPGADRWYQMGQLEKAFIDELGEDAGREAFKERFAKAMAATTGGADPTGNLLAAHYGNYLRATGKEYPSAAWQMPSPVGGRYITGNMEMHRKLSEPGAALNPDTNPKRYDFQDNFLGHENHATIDEQMMSILEPGGPQAPPNNAYGMYEQPVHEIAKQRGVSPREAQGLMWAGAKQDKLGGTFRAGKPMIETVNEAIERTHRLTGMPKDEIVKRGLIKGEIPLYGVGTALAASLAASGYYGKDEGPF